MWTNELCKGIQKKKSIKIELSTKIWKVNLFKTPYKHLKNSFDRMF